MHTPKHEIEAHYGLETDGDTLWSEPSPDARRQLVNFLAQNCIIRSQDEPIVSTRETLIEWLVDTRIAILNPAIAEIIASLYWNVLRRLGPCQLACIELTGVPFMVALQSYGAARGSMVNGFIIRKERKTTGRQRRIEGSINNLPIVFVDDVMNSGTSVKKAQAVLNDMGQHISHVIALVDFGATALKMRLRKSGIAIHVLITLQELGIEMWRNVPAEDPPDGVFEIRWRSRLSSSLTAQILPVSTPALDDDHLYVCTGSDEMYSINQSDGETLWRVVLDGVADKGICNTPTILNKTLFIGGRNGNIYTLSAYDGACRWTFRGADKVHGSIACSAALNLVYAAIENANENRQGSVLALDSNLGDIRWEFMTPGAVSSSPLYVPGHELVFVATASGSVYCLNANDGLERWNYLGLGESSAMSSADTSLGLLVIASSNKSVHALDLETGMLRWKTDVGGAAVSRPLVHAGDVFITCLDRTFYVLKASDGTVVKRVRTDGKLFNAPLLVGDKVYFGSSAGTVYEFSTVQNNLTGIHHLPEMLVSNFAFSEIRGTLFVATRESKVYSMRRHNV